MKGGEDRIVRVKAVVDARRERVVEKSPDVYEIAVEEKAEQGRANARIRELLAAALGVPPASLALISGARRPAKKFRVQGRGASPAGPARGGGAA